MEDLITKVTYIANTSKKLKDTIPDAIASPIEFACIFCQSLEEYAFYVTAINTLGKVVEQTKMGDTYLLDKPISTNAGSLRLVKVRKPDPLRSEQGDADFNTNYLSLKKKYRNHPQVELIKRDEFEMLRLSDSRFDVMACFSNMPKSKSLGINLV